MRDKNLKRPVPPRVLATHSAAPPIENRLPLPYSATSSGRTVSPINLNRVPPYPSPVLVQS